MPETATITLLDLEPSGRLRVGVTWSDGSLKVPGSVFAEPGTDLAGLQGLLRQMATRATTTKGLLSTLTLGQQIDLTLPAAVPDPDPGRTQWLQDYRLLQQILRGVQAGVLDSANKIVTDQLTLVQSTFKPAYVNAL